MGFKALPASGLPKRKETRMKALVVEKPLELSIQERDIPKPGAGEVLVRIRAAGICGSDFHAYQGHHPVVTFPRVLGHEMAGEVVETGAGVAERKSGDRVVVEPVINCGTCYSCRTDFPHNCFNLQFRGIHIDGGFQEYLVVPADKVYPVPQEMPFSAAALAEPLGIGLESAKIARLIPGDTVAILGSGPIGLASLLAVKENGHPAVVTDISDTCLKRAQALGADRVVNVRNEDMVEAVMEFTNGEGANVVMECAAATANFNPMMEAASICGRIVIVGLMFEEVTYSPYIQVRKHLHLLGTRNSNMIPRAIELLKKKGDAIEQTMVTHRVPFEEAAHGFRMMGDPEVENCKIILSY